MNSSANCKKVYYILFLLMGISATFYGTTQFSEIIKYNNKVTALHTEPLAEYIEEHEEFTTFLRGELICTALWRNYIGTWEIIDDKLYLIELKVLAPGKKQEMFDFKSLSLKKLFPQKYIDEKGRLFCFWFSGRLAIPENIHKKDSFGSRYYTFLEVVNGKVVGKSRSKERHTMNYSLKPFS